MRADPIKIKLKPPGTKRLKLNCDEPLSSVAFNFNLRRYNEGQVHFDDVTVTEAAKAGGVLRTCTRRTLHSVPTNRAFTISR